MAQINKPSEYFNTVLYTGNSTDDRAVTGVGFQPDFLWIKDRTSAFAHALFDVIRTPSQMLVSSSTDEEQTNAGSGGLTSFDIDGFTTDAGVGANPYRNTNQSGDSYVAWNWKANGAGVSNTAGSITSTVSANTTSGFSIVSWTGTGATGTVGHGLRAVPKMIIIKNRDSAVNWLVYHDSIPATNTLILNTTDASASDVAYNNTDPTSSVFSLGVTGSGNGSGNDLIAYCFAEKKGFSKFGSYTGNGSTTDGTFVYTGHSVAWVMIKQSNEARDWVIYDNKRDAFNVKDNFIVPNSSNAEGSGNTSLQIDFLSNGFKLRGGNHALNTSGGS